jgi:hypothetical protein
MTPGRRLWLLAAASAAGVATLWLGRYRAAYRERSAPPPAAPPVTVEHRVAQYGARVDTRLRAAFEGSGVSYPPAELALLAFKDAREVEVYARVPHDMSWQYIKTYPVLGASGRPGPKLAEGDRQVPEGVYHVEWLNPRSRFHLSLRLNYPNAFDRRMGAADGRTDLGTDIMIHGSSSSVGCLAIGDDAAEDLFILAARAGKDSVRVIIAPTDFRVEAPRSIMHEPRWVAMLYANLCEELKQFRRDA